MVHGVFYDEENYFRGTILFILTRAVRFKSFYCIDNFGCLATWVKRGEFEKTHAVVLQSRKFCCCIHAVLDKKVKINILIKR